MAAVRAAAVAGTFYPGERNALERAVRTHLEDARAEREPASGAAPPAALIVPHAGFVYSGPVAASAYVQIEPAAAAIERVVLLGPAHRVALRGIATPEADAFATPLGEVSLDREALAAVRALPAVGAHDAAHAPEHSLEVQLPFLQCVLGRFRLVPLVVGDAAPDEVRAVLELLWGGPETLVVVSSDLSHYCDYNRAVLLDRAATRAIEALRGEALAPESACGRIPIQGLLLEARRRGLRARALDVRNSGDTAGPRDSVVGYGAYALA